MPLELDQLKVSDGTGEPVIANVQSDRAIASTTLDVDSLDNWPQDFIFATGTVDADGYITPASLCIMRGHIDSSNIIIDGYAPGYSDSGNTSGQIAIIKPNTYREDQLVDWIQEMVDNGANTPRHAFGAYPSVATTLVNNTATKVTFGNELYDYDSNFASNEYTAPIDGVYHFDASVGFAGTAAAGSQLFTSIYVNGVEKRRGPLNNNPDDFAGASVSCDILLSAGDVVSVYTKQVTGANEDSSTSEVVTYFNGHIVRAT